MRYLLQWTWSRRQDSPELLVNAAFSLRHFFMATYFNKHTLCIAVALILIGRGAASGQAAASSDRADCEDTAFATAEKLRLEASPEAHLKALELYQKAWRCNLEPAPSLKAAEILLGMGRVQITMNNNPEAQANLAASLETFHQIVSKPIQVQNEEAVAAFNLAKTLSRLGHIDEALPLYNQAREVFHRLQDTPKEAFTLEELGLASFLMGENQSALEYFSQAMRRLDNLGAHNEERRRVDISDMRGRVYAAMNEPELARHYFQDALVTAMRIHYRAFVAYTLNDLGLLLLKQNKPSAAARYHRKALNILNRYNPEETDGIAETEAYLASCQAASGRYDSAIKTYQHALLLQQESRDLIGQAETHLSLGLAESASHQVESALQSLQNAAELYRRTHERDGESSARFEMAKIYALRGEDALARSEVMAAIKLAEEVRGFVPGPSLRITSFTSLEKMYRFEIDLLLKNQSSISASDQFLAFDLLQRAQSRTLLEALQHGKPADYLAFGGEILARRIELLQQLKEANQKLAWQLRNKSSPEIVDQTFIEVKRLEASLDQLDAEAQLRQPRMSIISPITISVPAIQQELLDEKEALVQFYLSSPASYAWIITRSGTQLIALPARELLKQQVRNAVNFGEAGQWTNAQGRALARLDRSMRPVFAAVQSTRWIVVPDGPLYSFPFALLSMTGKTEREIIKIPSASSVLALRSTNSGARAVYKLAVFADPVFDPEDSRVHALRPRAKTSPTQTAVLRHQKRQSNDNGSYPRLPNTSEEASLISAFVPREQRVSFLGFAANLEAIADNALSNFKIIHFATHSLVDDRHTELSRIVLSLVTKEGTARPGYLLLKDIYRMNLSSDLVVLSSCRAAAGAEGAGEGPMSLSRAFLFAGSRAVLASVWETNDEVTAKWMGQFYRHMLRENLSPLDALARTQSEFRRHRDSRLRNPYYWAGFELYGDWQGR
ncbi:MAG TPA: CHAT domain-containing tetratricopeptide repeat protein [Candidatus Angelobacter sp.]|nr:CHAT domain-containing tetratricopeptide repeat protein [Candidatus Angelobacter sp.]